MLLCSSIGSISLFGLLSGFTLAVSLFTFFGFDGIYNTVFDEQNVLKEENDGQLTKTTFWWTKPPVKTYQDFYFFNIMNPIDVEYFGATPVVQEVGPFVVKNVNIKDNLTFSEDGNKVKYHNYRTFIYDEELSCDTCKYDSLVQVPNLVALGTLGELADPRYEVPEHIQWAISYLMIFVGEYPFVQVEVGKLLFDGYNDALLSAAHSELVNFLQKYVNNKTVPVPFPEMHYMAMFNAYNNSHDSEYEVYTGKDDPAKKGQIISWNGQNYLPFSWWNNETTASDLRGTDSGQFAPAHLTPDTIASMFQSYMCRSFNLTYKKDTSVHGIKTYRFEGIPEDFDTTLPENAGFRYANSEEINYFENWPNCDGYEQNENITVNCTRPEFFCDERCNGSKVDNTYLLPPGMYPVNCYPGRPLETPFRLLFSAPHFAGSPKQVRESIIGYREMNDAGTVFSFDYEPKSGVPLALNLRFQLSIPFGRMDKFATFSGLTTTIIWSNMQ
ncbi:unnamed protein product [Bursaphelenchus okinawaensis]|uniref:Uncharacterized protein n=1 Tax=Bursaphelenchus okinawaensis TaxID=465554 RepID=A0A811JRJ1_9BILA|nr:unnamed protein product [Bursaphelenchus okinawaensis]CAG9079923.1 unnamed protein product [Bursaphelenchus okinawaensis]